MDRLSVTQARNLLQGARDAASSKETELQLMVGSRYHELIESADAIVSMHATASDLRQRLEHLPKAVQTLVDAHTSAEESKHAGASYGRNGFTSSVSQHSNAGTAAETRFYRKVLSIPPRIWSALDQRRYFEASEHLLEFTASPPPDRNTAASSFAKTVPVLNYGVLGQAVTATGAFVSRAPDPTAVPGTVIVDPAGLHHIQPPGGPRNAHGAAGAIYKFVGITSHEQFPADVVAAITKTSHAKYHQYTKPSTGSPAKGVEEVAEEAVHVIHVVGPDLRAAFGGGALSDGGAGFTRAQAVAALAEAYKNVLTEFVASGQPSLRLLPLSGGIFAGKFLGEIPAVTLEALEKGFQLVDPARQAALRAKQDEACSGGGGGVGMCVLADSDLASFFHAGFPQPFTSSSAVVGVQVAPNLKPPAWFHEFKLYMAPFQERIEAGAKCALRQTNSHGNKGPLDYSGALASLAVLGNLGPHETLDLFFASRSSWIKRALKGIPKHPSSSSSSSSSSLTSTQARNGNGGNGNKAKSSAGEEAAWARVVQRKLRTCLRTLQRTVADTKGLFIAHSSGGGGGAGGDGTSENVSPAREEEEGGSKAMPLVAAKVAKLGAVAQGGGGTAKQDTATNQCTTEGWAATATTAAAAAAEAEAALVKARCTVWVAREVKRVLRAARQTLAWASTAAVLASIRQALWAEAAETTNNTAAETTLAAVAQPGGSGGGGADKASSPSLGVPAEGEQLQQPQQPRPSWALDCAACVDGAQLVAALQGSGVRLDNLFLDARDDKTTLSSFRSGADRVAGFSMSTSPTSSAAMSGACGGGLNLWSLLFSKSFSELGEGLLRSSLREIRFDVEAKLSALLLALVGTDPNAAAAGSEASASGAGDGAGKGASTKGRRFSSLPLPSPSSSPSGGAWHGVSRFPSGRPCSELVTCAEGLADCLERQLSALRRDAHSLVIQHGDTHAARELSKSLHLRSVEMAAGLANHLRATAENLASLAKAEMLKAAVAAVAAGTADNGHSFSSANSSFSASAPPPASSTASGVEAQQQHLLKASRTVDGLLVVARLCRSLRCGDGALTKLLTVPLALAQPSPDRISIEQLQAAFIVTDNDGDGQLDASEATEAIESVLACGHLLNLRHDGGGGDIGDARRSPLLPTLTLSEFALVATAILEQPDPLGHFAACLDAVFSRAHEEWASVSVGGLARSLLAREATELASSAERVGAGSKEGYDSEATWRAEHGTWVAHHSSSSSSSSDMGDDKDSPEEPPLVVPADLTGFLHRFLFTAAAELKRVVGSSDYYCSSEHTSGEGEHGDGSGGKEQHGLQGSGGGGHGGEVGGVALEVRAALVGQVLDGVCECYQNVSVHVATMDGCAEAAVLMLLVDVMFLKSWVATAVQHASKPSSSSLPPASGGGGGGGGQSLQAGAAALAQGLKRLESVEQALATYVDPINLELFKPHLRATCRKALGAAHHVLGLLLPVPAAATAWGVSNSSSMGHVVAAAAGAAGGSGGGEVGGGNTAPDDGYLESSTNLLPLARPVRRFALLPLPLDAIQLSVASGVGTGVGGAGAGSSLGGSANLTTGSKYGDDGGGAVGGGFLSNLRFKW